MFFFYRNDLKNVYVNIFVLAPSSENESINLEMIVVSLHNYCSVYLLAGSRIILTIQSHLNFNSFSQLLL